METFTILVLSVISGFLAAWAISFAQVATFVIKGTGKRLLYEIFSVLLFFSAFAVFGLGYYHFVG